MKKTISLVDYKAKDEIKVKADLAEAQELIYQVLEHVSAGRFNQDLMKQKLIQAAKNLNIPAPLKLSKYF